MTNSREYFYVELDPTKLPSMLELYMKFSGGKTSLQRSVNLTAADSGQYAFHIESDMDYSGWDDEGSALRTEDLPLLGFFLPELVRFAGTVTGHAVELTIYPEDEDGPAENLLEINVDLRSTNDES